MTRFKHLLLLLPLAFMLACKSDPPASQTATTPPVQVTIPAFDRDSAFAYVEQQVSFGPRNLGSEGHEACKNWLSAKMEEFGMDVTEQTFTAELPTGEQFPATNIIGRYRPDLNQRVLLCAHWDTRYKAEKDSDVEDRDEPILGADDGASGVGVLLEIARVLQNQPLDMGIDMVFFDAEDQGENGGTADAWCLGSQYWSRNLSRAQRPAYGVLLDMVGAKGATFPKEGTSLYYARSIVDKTWSLAQSMGYGHFFINDQVPGITDDHQFINDITGIPTIDIINYPNGGFGAYHHTSDDNMEIIDRQTLRAVGQVVTALIYKESVGAI